MSLLEWSWLCTSVSFIFSFLLRELDSNLYYLFIFIFSFLLEGVLDSNLYYQLAGYPI
jgi:hypothetical protein